jgi:hypothetical protein
MTLLTSRLEGLHYQSMSSRTFKVVLDSCHRSIWLAAAKDAAGCVKLPAKLLLSPGQQWVKHTLLPALQRARIISADGMQQAA